jgi:sugar lactone lactonase YvrE
VLFLTPSLATAAPLVQKVAGLGVNLENVAVLPNGSYALSDTTNNSIRQLTPDGVELAPLAQVAAPGGLAVYGNALYIVGNHTAQAALLSQSGWITRVDLATGQQTPFAANLSYAGLGLSPNGLASTGDGSFVFTVSLGLGQGTYRVDASGAVTLLNGLPTAPNGVSVAADGSVYVSSTTQGWAAITQLSATGQIVRSGGIAPLADDLTVTPDGSVFITDHVGELVRYGQDGSISVYASGLGQPSAVKSAPGGLVAVTFDGEVYHISL